MRTRSPRLRKPVLHAGVLTLVAAVVGHAQVPAMASPEAVGLSSAALDAIGPAMQELIDSARTGGIMTMVARRGQVVHWEARGWRILGEDPLEPNDIFRIYSMTKPVTGVAAMTLVEEGLLSLSDPVSDYLPAFAEVRVYEGADSTRRPSRSLTVFDLLTHTSGLTYGAFGATPVDSIYVAAGVPWELQGDLEANVDFFASLPLLSDPGVDWNYSVSFDVLGRVIEVVSGMPLDQFFQQRIFGPLGMDDTGFQVPAEKLGRFTALYATEGDGLKLIDSADDGEFTRPAVWLAGGHGLTSTAVDYLRFTQMLLNEGALDGVRILEPETVRSIRRNHLADELLPIDFFPGNGFGLGFAVALDEHRGLFWWLGVGSTNFWIDPDEELIAFAWSQYRPSTRMPIDGIMRHLVYGAILEGR